MAHWSLQLINECVESLVTLSANPEGIAIAQALNQSLRDQWAEHGAKELKQQRNLMTAVRRAIKDRFGENHWSLAYITFTKAEWTIINQPIEEQVALRNEQVQQLHNPDAIVAQAVRLLGSREWADIAAGLAVLTGRRSSEILATAQFEKKSQWSVIFTGALKRRGESQTLSFEIPTLTTADQVITALDKLRSIVDVQGLDVRQINGRYSATVASACDRQFSDLVPNRIGRDNLYTHLFRSVYATIATFWYCPANVNETEFKAAIQGHYQILDEHDPTLRRSIAASRHYSDYEIADEVIAYHKGKRKGIKLGLGGIEVIDAFKLKQVSAALEELPVRSGKDAGATKPKVARLQLWQSDMLRLQALFEQAEAAGNQADRVHQFLNWLEQQLEKTSDPVSLNPAPPEPEAIPAERTIADQARTLAWLTSEIEMLRRRNVDLVQERDILSAKVQAQDADAVSIREIKQLQQQVEEQKQTIAHLGKELQTATDRLAAFRRLLDGVSETTSEKPEDESYDPPNSAAQQVSEIKAKPVASARSTSSAAEERVNYAIDRIMEYNNVPGRPAKERIAVSQFMLKGLRVNGVMLSQDVIRRVLETRPDVEEHHRHYGIGRTQNRSRPEGAIAPQTIVDQATERSTIELQ